MMRNIAIGIGGFFVGGLAVWTALAQEPVPTSVLPFSAARQAGETLYLSGQIARTPDGESVRDSVAAETRQTMDNLGAVLEENGYAWRDVVNVTVYLRDIEDYTEMNAAYRTYFDGAFPARACVGGVEIVFGHRVEISAIAYKAD
jgi:2-iminobutanoate/2-iminopropanoate deaminase